MNPSTSIYSEPPDELEVYAPEIIVPGRLDNHDEIPSRTVGALANKLGADWEYAIGYSQFHIAGKEYGPKAQKAGESHGERIVDNVWIDAVNLTRKRRFTATWHDGKFVDAIWSGRIVNSTMLKKLIAGELDDPPHVDWVPRIAREKEYE